MPQFPDDRSFPRSKDGSEPILGGSIGMNRILLMLKETAPHTNRMVWSAVLLNTFTIFRNIYQKGLSPQDFTQRFRTDTDLFRLYLDAYMTTFGAPQITIPLVLYVPDYRYFHKDDLRELSDNNAEMLQKYQQFIKSIPAGESLFSTSDGTTLWTVTVGTATMLPHIALAHWLQDKALASNQFGYRYGLPVMLISHCPVDLHIYRRLPQIHLVESYQGLIKPVREFGSKLSSHNEAVPFTTATHRAFGDPVHLAPLADQKQRKTLLEMAVTKRWLQRPNEAILQDIATVTGKSIAELTRIRL